MASIAAVDPRIRIVWEDCGAFPYAYMPENLTGRAETAAFTDELAHLRPNASVGVVFKGMICLDWTTFVHRTAPERIGEASETAIAQRQPMARRIMRLVQSSCWIPFGSWPSMRTARFSLCWKTACLTGKSGSRPLCSPRHFGTVGKALIN